MRFIFFLLAIAAALLTVSIVGLTILSILNGGSVLFPGLGLVVALPFLILLLAIVDAVVIVLALLAKRMSEKPFGREFK